MLAATAFVVTRLWLGSVLAIAACYAPETPDCVLACEADGDCAGGQTCASDHLCASPATATCAGRTMSDGGTVGSDAGGHDAGVAMVTVTIQISGGGSVDASPGQNCDSGTCQFAVPVSTAITLTAIDHGMNMFQMWTTSQCAGQNRMCHFAPATSTTVGVKFGH